ncbi:AbrB family transcriptional regulator [Salirhabdus salicampi]|uniref:AbrB family transcriptional regulator n=1 Tax=Salirhabdus salicampi TaxID=476102 RepID=UPI0020C324B5|nr:AbrB family transcriptional regulator [Salirhabdus salicampi]MCP8615922.1 AbrB family transcriptional regulator [Salirhabdus salicampi]
MDTLLFLAIAFVGGSLGSKLKIPAGALMGSMILIGTWQCIGYFEPLEVHSMIKWIGQSILGVTLALMFKKNTMKLSKYITIFIVLFGFLTIVYSALIAWFMTLITNLNFINAYLAVIPGGFAEMLILTDTIGGNVSGVALFHFIRLMLLLLTIPYILKWLNAKQN